MAKKVKARLKAGHARHYIREWRKFRGLTLERLADRINVTAGAIGQLERGEVGYTQPMLEALAEALQTKPGALVSWPPGRDPGMSDILLNATPEQEQTIRTMAEALVRKTGTHN